MLDDPARRAQPDQLEPVSDPAVEGPVPVAEPSLTDDITALYEDGRTYVEAELAFQKTRASFVGDKAKKGIVFALGALAFLHLALIGLVIGLIIALEPFLTAFGATAAVVLSLLIGMAVLGKLAANKFGRIGEAFADDEA